MEGIKERKRKRGYEWIVIRITYAQSEREASEEMGGDKHGQRSQWDDRKEGEM